MGLLHDAELLRLARRGLAHLRGARDRRRGEHGRDARDLQLVDRPHQPDRLDDLARRRRPRPATILLASNSADGGSGLASVVFQRSPAGAGTWTATPASWDTTLVSDGDYDLRVVTSDLGGQRHGLGRDHGHGRQHAAEHEHHLAAGRPDERDGRIVRLLVRGGRDLRGSPRRRRLDPEREPEELQRPDRGLAHLPGARDRPRRQRRRDAGHLHVDGRHDGAEHEHHVAARRPDKPDRRVLRVHLDRGRLELRGSPRRRRLERRARARRPTAA